MNERDLVREGLVDCNEGKGEVWLQNRFHEVISIM